MQGTFFSRRTANIRRILALCASIVPFFACVPAQAQVQRTMLDLGFEQPDLGPTACFRQTDANVVPGWNFVPPGTRIAWTIYFRSGRR